MSNEPTFDTHTYYRGAYRHINYEIWNETRSYNDCWAGYIMLNNHQCDIKLKYDLIELMSGRSSIYYRVYENPLLKAIDDVVHGGVTLTEITTQADFQETLTLKIGWDYSHYNSGYTDVDRVYFDCKEAVDALWEFNPNIKVHCSTVGGYHLLADGVVKENGVFISNAGIKWRIEQGWETTE